MPSTWLSLVTCSLGHLVPQGDRRLRCAGARGRGHRIGSGRVRGDRLRRPGRPLRNRDAPNTRERSPAPLAAACAKIGCSSVEVLVDIVHVVTGTESYRRQSSLMHLVTGDRAGSDPIHECVDLIDPVALAPTDDSEATRIRGAGTVE